MHALLTKADKIASRLIVPVVGVVQFITSFSANTLFKIAPARFNTCTKIFIPQSHKHNIPFQRSNSRIVTRFQRKESAFHACRVNKMKCHLQIISTPTADTPGTLLLLHYDEERILIGNVAEGAQRSCLQRKVGLNKLSHIFLTGAIGWPTSGGLLGMVLSAADSQITSTDEKKQMPENKTREMKRNTSNGRRGTINLHGGKNLTHMIATARQFVFRHGMPLKTQEFKKGQGECELDKPHWSDKYARIWAVVTESETVPRRKRSHDEYAEGLREDGTQIANVEEDENSKDRIRKTVVSNMFGSQRMLDNLVEKRLSDVKQPTAIFVRNNGIIKEYSGPMPEQEPSAANTMVLVRNPWPGSTVKQLPPTTPSKSTVSYIIKNHEQRGKFMIDKALALGIVPGYRFKELTSGNSVTAEDGSTVHPHQVLQPGKPGGGFAVLDIVDETYIGPLLARKEWTDNKLMEGVEAMIWITGPGVLLDSRVQEFMQKHTELKHIVSSKDCCPDYLAFESPAAAAIRLNMLDSKRFPIPSFSNTLSNGLTGNAPYVRAQRGQLLQLEPSFEIQDEQIVPYLDTAKVVEEAPQEVLLLADAARMEIENPEYQAALDKRQEDIPCKYAEIVTLGTGSAAPSKYRSVSATLLRVPEYGNYLFDCGENTLGQMRRVFGDKTPDELRKLKVIWISHLHADHHLGIVSIIKAWHEATKTSSNSSTKLIIASDQHMHRYLSEYSEVEEFGYNRILPVPFPRTSAHNVEFEPKEISTIGLKSMSACPVAHTLGSLAVVFDFPNGFRVAYSGDCRPSSHFAEIGKGATLLIHEATFEDELQGDAKAKKHSTISEALGVAREMQAKRIILTHFSQRYQKIPVMTKVNESVDQVAIVAFDYMRVRVGDIAKIEKFRPAFMKLYEGVIESSHQ